MRDITLMDSIFATKKKNKQKNKQTNADIPKLTILNYSLL